MFETGFEDRFENIGSFIAYFAGISLSAKASSGIGALIAGLVLDLIGFPHGIAAQGVNAHIAPNTVMELGLIYGPGAAIVSFISVTILFAHKLDGARHMEILQALGRAPAAPAA